MCACAIARVRLCVGACTRVGALGLRTCLSRRYAMAEIPWYHWALALSTAVWTRVWTHPRVRLRVCGPPRARFLGSEGAMGGFAAALHALRPSHFSVGFSDRPRKAPQRSCGCTDTRSEAEGSYRGSEAPLRGHTRHHQDPRLPKAAQVHHLPVLAKEAHRLLEELFEPRANSDCPLGPELRLDGLG